MSLMSLFFLPVNAERSVTDWQNWNGTLILAVIGFCFIVGVVVLGGWRCLKYIERRMEDAERRQMSRQCQYYMYSKNPPDYV